MRQYSNYINFRSSYPNYVLSTMCISQENFNNLKDIYIKFKYTTLEMGNRSSVLRPVQTYRKTAIRTGFCSRKRIQNARVHFGTYLRCKSEVLNPFTRRIYSGIYLKRSVHVLLEGLAWD